VKTVIGTWADYIINQAKETINRNSWFSPLFGQGHLSKTERKQMWDEMPTMLEQLAFRWFPGNDKQIQGEYRIDVALVPARQDITFAKALFGQEDAALAWICIKHLVRNTVTNIEADAAWVDRAVYEVKRQRVAREWSSGSITGEWEVNALFNKHFGGVPQVTTWLRTPKGVATISAASSTAISFLLGPLMKKFGVNSAELNDLETAEGVFRTPTSIIAVEEEEGKEKAVPSREKRIKFTLNVDSDETEDSATEPDEGGSGESRKWVAATKPLHKGKSFFMHEMHCGRVRDPKDENKLRHGRSRVTLHDAIQMGFAVSKSGCQCRHTIKGEGVVILESSRQEEWMNSPCYLNYLEFNNVKSIKKTKAKPEEAVA